MHAATSRIENSAQVFVLLAEVCLILPECLLGDSIEVNISNLDET